MRDQPVLVMFCGGLTGSPIEETLASALRECALDTLDEALSSGAYDGAIVVADRPSATALDGHLPGGARLDADPPGAFHFGRRLARVILDNGLQRPVYAGWGLPLVKADELAAVAQALETVERPLVVTNNFYSADFFGLTPSEALQGLDLPANDRVLPRWLVQQAGFANQSLPRTMQNQFDLDSPGDLALLAYAGGAGPRLWRWLEQHPPETERLARAAWLFTDPLTEVLVAGRVGSSVWQFLESETACRVRIFAEERGMQAMERDSKGEARSLLAFHLQAVGPRRFFEELAEMVQGAFIDTRAIFVHLGLQPSRADRFLSDALQPEGIRDPWLRDFTVAARDAAIPVVLGGSSLVAAGVQLLSEAAWRRHDQMEAEYKLKGRARGAERAK
jgi:hypothetical protein